ncbi:Small subunit (SSU) processome component, partial [Dipsacomyces acuminosporus]
NQHIAILLARFSRVSGDEGNVNIVRGSSLKPLLETLSLADVDGQFESEVVLAREPQGNLLVQGGRTDAEKKMAAQQQTYSEANATITNPALEAARKSQKAADEAISAQGTPSLADRIKELSTDAAATATANAKDAKDSGLKHKTIAEEPKLQAGTLVRVLVQSLHTDDQALLDSVIKNSARTSVVRETVMGLPTSYVVLFLQQLFSRYQTSPGRAMHLLPWIRNVFAIHSGYLTSIPNLVPQLSGFYQGIQTRLETHQRLLKLNGRLEIANIQIRARSMFEQEKKDDIKVAHMKPLSVYRESEDEEEEDAAMDQDENVPAWQAEESTDDEELSGAESQDDDQWSDSDSDDNGEADSDESEDDGASGSEDGSDEPSSDDNSDDDGDDLEEYE